MLRPYSGNVLGVLKNKETSVAGVTKKEVIGDKEIMRGQAQVGPIKP